MSILFAILALVWLIYLRPKFERKKDALIFDNRVLSFIDGLYLSGMRFGCADFEMRSYVARLLRKAHALPGTEHLIEHAISVPQWPKLDGMIFRSHIGLHGEHISFAILCIIEYAKEYDKHDLLVQCDQLLTEARQMGVNYH